MFAWPGKLASSSHTAGFSSIGVLKSSVGSGEDGSVVAAIVVITLLALAEVTAWLDSTFVLSDEDFGRLVELFLEVDEAD
jgi:hypothetical protein